MSRAHRKGFCSVDQFVSRGKGESSSDTALSWPSTIRANSKCTVVVGDLSLGFVKSMIRSLRFLLSRGFAACFVDSRFFLAHLIPLPRAGVHGDVE